MRKLLNTKFLKNPISWVAFTGAAALAFVIPEQDKKLRANNRKEAEWCIKQRGESLRCDDVNARILPSDIAKKFSVAKARREKIVADQIAQAKAKDELSKAEAKAGIARMEQEKIKRQLAAEAKFKAEGWWKETNGIYVRWCTDENPCPGSPKDHYTKVVWRAMVWCKERPCGDIYARLNISKDDVIIGWTNATGYGDYGQKVVLTFGSHLSGNGQIVDFRARG